MKRAFTALLLVAVTLACSKDTDDELTRTGTLESRIAQSWILVSAVYETYIPNPINPNQSTYVTGVGEDIYGYFRFQSDYTADYQFGVTAAIDIGTSEPLRLPFYREGSGTWWMVGVDSVYLEDGIDTLKWEIIEDWDQKQRWQAVIPIFDTTTDTKIPMDTEVVLRRE